MRCLPHICHHMCRVEIQGGDAPAGDTWAGTLWRKAKAQGQEVSVFVPPIFCFFNNYMGVGSICWFVNMTINRNFHVTPDTAGFSSQWVKVTKLKSNQIEIMPEPLTMLPHDSGHLILVANFRLLCFRQPQYDFERDMQHNTKFKSAQIRYQ